MTGRTVRVPTGLADGVAALARELGVAERDVLHAAWLAALSFVADSPEVSDVDGPVPDGTWVELVRFAAGRADAPELRRAGGHVWVTVPLPAGVSGADADDPAARLPDYFVRALAAMTAEPAARHETADLLPAAERRRLCHEWAGRQVELPDLRFAELFARQARRTPAAPAVSHRGETWSYERLDRAANAVAHRLLADGVAVEEVVAVATGRNLWWAAALVGVLRAGAAYLPVDPDLPAARVATLLRESRCRHVLTADHVAEVLEHADRWDDPGMAVAAGQLAYVYFTSGSTGVPKGAMCEHAGLVNHLLAKIGDLGLTEADVVVQSAPVSFDISLWQLIAPLVVGARSLIVPPDAIADPSRFVETIESAGATVLQVVPSYLDVLLRRLDRRLDGLRYVSVTGEALAHDLAARWFARHPDVPLVNAYGATEACDDATHAIITEPPPVHAVPVGRALPNVTVQVLGRGGRLLPAGSIGEIVFAGVCVGRGYLNDPRRTAEAFDTDPSGVRRYWTGDLGRWLPNGELVFRGRRDDQVKIRGMRVEPGEVAARVREHPAVTDAAVVVLRPAGVPAQLAGFYQADPPVEPAELARFLAAALPAAARPARLHPVASIPRTTNGKTDRRALADLVRPAGRADESTPPAGSAQHRIAGVFAAVLGLPVAELTAESDFFGLGGDSLSAIRAVSALDGLVALDDLLRTPVLGRLAELVDQTGGRA